VKILPQALLPLQRLILEQQEPSQDASQCGVRIFQVTQEDNGGAYILQPPNSRPSDPANSIAVINTRHGNILSQLAERQCFFDAYSASTDAWSGIANGQNDQNLIGKDAREVVDIVVYGQNQSANDIGDLLDSQSVFLQAPDYQDKNYGYHNPHMLDFNDLRTEQDDVVGGLVSTYGFSNLAIDSFDTALSSQTPLKTNFEMALKKMTRAQNLHRIKADGGMILTPLKS
jgi:hypothetical protein